MSSNVQDNERQADIIVIGAGQAGLSTAFYLRRTSLSYRILDAQREPGAAWLHTWESLRLFSPARFSSLPGRLMEGGPDYYPSKNEVIAYLRAYEEHYGFPVERPVRVEAVLPGQDRLRVVTDRGTWLTRAVVSATGSLDHPYTPAYPGREHFQGVQIHSREYRSPEQYRGKRVLIVGGGNSGAQIMAEVAPIADASWVTLAEPSFLPDDVDGRYLFNQATERYRALQEGRPVPPPATLEDIVMVPPVREARARGDLVAVRPFEAITSRGVIWPDGREETVDVIIWCTGFRPALEHLRPLGVVESDGRVAVRDNRSLREPRLWLVGYGQWTGFASATLIGVGRSARSVAQQIDAALAPSAS